MQTVPPVACALPRPITSARGRAGRLLLCLVLLSLWFVLYRHLSNEWSVNEQYTYGWFVPLLALLLLWLRWEDRPENCGSANAERGSPAEQRTGPDSFPRKIDWGRHSGRSSRLGLAVAFFALLLLLPLRVFEIGNPDWRPLGWLHAIIVVSLSLLLVWSAGGARWLRHFSFPIAFIFVAVPWVTPIEAPVVQGLMRTVAAIATEILDLCGIPAQLEGSVIHVATGVVGVNEACSGVRSLQTALMIGLLFGELRRLTPKRRIVLVAAAVAIAFAANVLRTFLLVFLAATRGLAAVNQWHDVAGYSIVIAVFLGTIGVASMLGGGKEGTKKIKRERDRRPTAVSGTATSPFEISDRHSGFLIPTFSFLLFPLAWLLFVELGAAAWYRAHETNLVPRVRWTIRFPEAAPGFHDVRIDENVRRTLRFDEGRGAIWQPASLSTSRNSLGDTDAAPRLHYLLYFFRWEAGSSSVLRARAHRPDICLPNTGWRQTADNGARSYPAGEQLHLPFRHFEFVHRRDDSARQFAHAFFCVREDWVKAQSAASTTDESISGKIGGWMRSDRLRIVLDGQRDLGQQVMELVLVSREQFSKVEAEDRFAVMLKEIVVLKPSSSRQ